MRWRRTEFSLRDLAAFILGLALRQRDHPPGNLGLFVNIDQYLGNLVYLCERSHHLVLGVYRGLCDRASL